MKIKNKRGYKRERAKSCSTQKPVPKNYDSGKSVCGGGGGAYSYLKVYFIKQQPMYWHSGSLPYLAQRNVPERISDSDVRAEAGGGDLARSANSVEVFLYNLMIPWSSPVRDPGDNLLSATVTIGTSKFI